MKTDQEIEYQETLELHFIDAIDKIGVGEVLLLISSLCHNQADHYCLTDEKNLETNWNTVAKQVEIVADNILKLSLWTCPIRQGLSVKPSICV